MDVSPRRPAGLPVSSTWIGPCLSRRRRRRREAPLSENQALERETLPILAPRPTADSRSVAGEMTTPAVVVSTPSDAASPGDDLEPVAGTTPGPTPGTRAPAVFRPPPPSPSERFAWRDHAAADQAGVHGHDGLPPCAFPDCVKEAKDAGLAGSDKKTPITNSMMKAYVAMRVGANSVAVGGTEPLLARLFHPELVWDLGAPRMVHDIQQSMNPNLPDNPNRPEVYYYDPYFVQSHVPIPPGYGMEAVQESLDDKWPCLTTAFGGQPSPRDPNTTHDNENDKGKGEGKEIAKDPADAVPADYDPFVMDAMVSPGTRFPFNPYFDDGWVSDDEGHPGLTRISPCTFARWATDCAPTKPKEGKEPVIPTRSSSLRCLEPKQRTKSPLAETPPRPASTLISEIDAVEAVKEIGALKRSLTRLIKEKEQLRGDIEALHKEREELEAKMRAE
ncbi:hypothetical protein C8A01DRAFT_36895 [Parachaetomium inaequale]|uniref:Uncharacterized protein n=1 Tax=Parachaetomium inaequale TaxID=2588326 RepID=A0AAN6PFG6_9PEZI|nr:hypothetical protein C8A01DRAFT_36895 [Parachaetomium inaequale]